MNSTNRFDNLYLLAGHITDHKTGAFKPGSLTPVANAEFFIKNTDGGFSLIVTDSRGLIGVPASDNSESSENESSLVTISSSLLTKPGDIRTIYGAPENLVFDAVKTKGEQWKNFITEAIEELKEDTEAKAISCKVRSFTISTTRHWILSKSTRLKSISKHSS